MPVLTVATQPHAHLAGTLLPRGFFLGLGLIYLAALALDRLAARWRLPGAAAILLLGLLIPIQLLAQAQPLGALQLETLHRVSLALLIFYAGLRTDLRRIRGMAGAGLRLGSLGVLITVAITALALLALAPAGLPASAALLTVCCLGATDSGALEDLLEALRQPIGARFSHLLQFEAALSTLTTLLAFSFLVSILQGAGQEGHEALHGAVIGEVPQQLAALGLHLIGGAAAGLLVGLVAPRLIDALVRSEPQLLLVTVALAFVTYGFGQILGGGGLVAVFVAGVCFSNGRYRNGRFEPQALTRVMHPFNTAAEITVLLLLGLLVRPAALLTMLPLGLALAVVLLLARLAAVRLLLPPPATSGRERLVVTGCGLRAAVPLALAVSMSEELPHLRGLTPELAETLGPQLLALVFVVVLADLLLQTWLMHRLQWSPRD
jgi:cell volume regulation protein A